MEIALTTDNINLRSAPNKEPSTKILRVLTKGTQVTILDRNSAPWVHVQLADTTIGYVHGDLIKIVTAPAVQPAAEPTSAAQPAAAQPAAQPIASQPAAQPAGAGTAPPLATSAMAEVTGLYHYIESAEDTYIIPQAYHDFQAQREKLGLPAPFDVSPVHLENPASLQVNGFGPNTFALNNWSNWYTRVCGMHNGFDYNVATGTPLLALSDAVVVGDRQAWPFMASRYEKTLVIWCLLPESIKDSNGNRMLSNVIIAYGHMSDNSTVKKGQMVKAGQIIGYSGYPRNEDGDSGKLIEQPGNAHLHMEVHMLAGDNHLPFSRKRNPGLLRAYKKPQPFDNNTPFNPLLFFSERLVKYHVFQSTVKGRKYPDAGALGKFSITNWPSLDWFTVAYFQYPGQRYANIIWKAKNPPPWPDGVYDVPAALQRIQNYTPFEPYPIPASF